MRPRPSTTKTSKAQTLYSSTSAVTLSSIGSQVVSQTAPAFSFGKEKERKRPTTPGPSDYRGQRSTLRTAGAGGAE
eukprot:3631379-Prymnesium_polylepis.1